MTSKIEECEDPGMQNIPLVTTPGHVHWKSFPVSTASLTVYCWPQ